MPRAIVIGISLTTVCYLMVNVAYVTVLGSAGILASEAVAVVSLGRHKFPTLHSKLCMYITQTTLNWYHLLSHVFAFYRV